MSKDQWIADHERAIIEYENSGDFEWFAAEMRDLGFDEREIKKAAKEIDDER